MKGVHMFGNKKKHLELAVRDILNSWLADNKRELVIISEKAKALETDLGRIGDRITQIEGLRVKGSIADQIVFSDRFKNTTQQALQIAVTQYYPLTTSELSPSMATLRGEVDEKDFGITIGSKQVVVVYGLKTKYVGKDQGGTYRLQIRDKLQKPFAVSKGTDEVIFFNDYFLQEGEIFGIKRLEGTGKLLFRVLGITISPNLFL